MASYRTALVTGATSGLGLETAAQLAGQGYDQVIMTGRTLEKAAAAVAEVSAATGKDVFEPLALDLDKGDSVEQAATELASRNAEIDLAVLNAGIAPTKELRRNGRGLELTVTSSLIGHHMLTVRMLEKGLFADDARIVIAGSEAARGDVPTFKPVDMYEMADKHFGGVLEAAIEAQMRMEPPAEYKPSDTYATAKAFVAWWVAELARLLPEGMAVNAVSPGSTPDTNAIDNAPFYMRRLMIPLFKLVPGMSHSVADGARRYLEVAGYDASVTGKFFASKPGKMTGPLAEVELDHLNDRGVQSALWNVATRAAGEVKSPAA
jgi:NAD(P)-dependent dehydrogenase (short-subunit alcohol dehydrogenase family)